MNDAAQRNLLSELDAEIRALIERTLSAPFTSHSSLDNIVTGNAYQSVALRGEVRPGFRARETFLYAGLPMRGARFVDLGANLGEKTRLAAEAGALYAEGIEYEPLFVRVGGLVNVYNGAGNVVLRQGDITKPGCLSGEFDLGACFSAFVYLRQNLRETLERIRGLFLLETHALDGGWMANYPGEIEPILPHWMVVGFTDHGRGHEGGRRALIVFGRDPDAVERAGRDRAATLPHDHGDVRTLDLDASPRIARLWGENERSAAVFADLRAALRGRPEGGTGALASLLRDRLPALAATLAANPAPRRDFASDLYWLNLLTGVAELLGSGTVAPTNAYVAFLGDPVRAEARLEAVAHILRGGRPAHPFLLQNPLRASRLEGVAPEEHLVLADGGAAFRAQRIDGQHRLAALWLAGARGCAVLPAWTNLHGFGHDAFPAFAAGADHDGRLRAAIAAEVLEFEPRASDPAG